MRSEAEVEHSIEAPRNSRVVERQQESTFGVQSLADTLSAAFGREDQAEDIKCEDGQVPGPRAALSRASLDPSKPDIRDLQARKSSPLRTRRRRISNHSISNPPTPLDVDSPLPLPTSAMPSTPTSASLQSLKLSDEDAGLDDNASPAIMSSGDEGTALDDATSFPQLVMPSIQMPSRRPFTAKGKAMGKLKVLVAGQAGM